MRSNRARFLVALLAALCLLAFALACSKNADDMEDAADSGSDDSADVATTPYKPSGQEGSIVGTISFQGAAPAPKAISMEQDPVCASSNPNAAAEDLVVNGDKVQNVFVYIKEGKTDKGANIAGFSFDPPPTPATLDQHGCHYVPHVLGIQVKQPFQVVNSDATSHNVNVQAAKNEKFNQGQGPGAAPIDKKFQRAEVLIPVKCNQHPWMKAYIGVVKHPFYAVTKEDGSYEIKGVPPGTYTVVAWHEKGPTEKTAQVTVPAKGAVTSDFTFDASAMALGTQGNSLQVLPAIELPMLGRH